MQKKDAASVLKLYNSSMETRKIKYKMSQEDIIHFLMPKDKVVWTWVIENEVDGKKVVTDFFSMHRITQQCMKADQDHTEMHSGSLWYYGLSKNTYVDMIKTVLWLSLEEAQCDAFSVMSIMDNNPRDLAPLGFLPGDGCLHYYLVNWSTGSEVIRQNELGCILV